MRTHQVSRSRYPDWRTVAVIFLLCLALAASALTFVSASLALEQREVGPALVMLFALAYLWGIAAAMATGAPRLVIPTPLGIVWLWCVAVVAVNGIMAVLLWINNRPLYASWGQDGAQLALGWLGVSMAAYLLGVLCWRRW